MVNIVVVIRGDGLLQMVSESLMTVGALHNVTVTVAFLFYAPARKSLIELASERKVPHAVEWVTIGIWIVTGYLLMNWIVISAGLWALMTKRHVDSIRTSALAV